MSMIDIPKTYGSLLLGGLLASLLSGSVFLQVCLYLKVHPSDTGRVKALVFAVWLLDVSHTSLIWSFLWNCMIDDYGTGLTIFNNSHWNVALTIVMTAILALLVHSFFAHRIFVLSQNNYWVAAPIVALAVLRLASASITAAEMIHYERNILFRDQSQWIFTAGLAVSSVADMSITVSLLLLPRTNRTRVSNINLNAVIDVTIRYTFETGTLTCPGTVISIICWLAMHTSLVFMGMHFVVGKVYANSLLVTLNMRQNVPEMQSNNYVPPIRLRQRNTMASPFPITGQLASLANHKSPS